MNAYRLRKTTTTLKEGCERVVRKVARLTGAWFARDTFRSFTKTVALLTAICFLYSSVLNQALYAMVAPGDDASRRISVTLNEFSLPYSLGRITDAKYLGSNRVVINIQDLHCHSEVQKNISRILSLLDDKYHLSKIYVEGGIGAVDTSWVKLLPNKEYREAVVTTLLDGGILSGSEYYSIRSGRYDLLKGIEDADLYTQNLVRLGVILDQHQEIQSRLPGLKNDLNALKDRYYSDRNRKLDTLVDKRAAGKISTDKYYKFLFKLADAANIDLNRYQTTSSFIALLDLQKRLSYPRIGKQLVRFIRSLKQRLPYDVYQQLTEKAADKERLEELYVALVAVAREYRLELSSEYRELNDFFAFVDANQKLNPLALIQEEKQLLRELHARLAVSGSERDISFLSDFFGYVEAYLGNKISAEDYAYYTAHLPEFKQAWSKYTVSDNLPSLENYYAVFDTFYSVNVERNNRFLKNIFGANVPAAGGEVHTIPDVDHLSKVTDSLKDAKEVIVVVTGGFHTTGLTDLLKDRDISYLVITPNVTQDTKIADRTYAELAREQAELFATQAFALYLWSLQIKWGPDFMKYGRLKEAVLIKAREMNVDEDFVLALEKIQTIDRKFVTLYVENALRQEPNDPKKVFEELAKKCKEFGATLKMNPQEDGTWAGTYAIKERVYELSAYRKNNEWRVKLPKKALVSGEIPITSDRALLYDASLVMHASYIIDTKFSPEDRIIRIKRDDSLSGVRVNIPQDPRDRGEIVITVGNDATIGQFLESVKGPLLKDNNEAIQKVVSILAAQTPQTSDLHSVSGGFWGKIPFIGSKLSRFMIGWHEMLHWVADPDRKNGTIDIDNGTYTPTRPTAFIALFAPIGSLIIGLGLIAFGVVIGYDSLPNFLGAVVAQLAGVLPLTDGLVNLSSSNPLSDWNLVGSGEIKYAKTLHTVTTGDSIREELSLIKTLCTEPVQDTRRKAYFGLRSDSNWRQPYYDGGAGQSLAKALLEGPSSAIEFLHFLYLRNKGKEVSDAPASFPAMVSLARLQLNYLEDSRDAKNPGTMRKWVEEMEDALALQLARDSGVAAAEEKRCIEELTTSTDRNRREKAYGELRAFAWLKEYPYGEGSTSLAALFVKDPKQAVDFMLNLYFKLGSDAPVPPFEMVRIIHKVLGPSWKREARLDTRNKVTELEKSLVLSQLSGDYGIADKRIAVSMSNKPQTARSNFEVLQDIVGRTITILKLDPSLADALKMNVYKYLYKKLTEELNFTFDAAPTDLASYEKILKPAIDNKLKGQNALKYIVINVTNALNAAGPRYIYAFNRLSDKKYIQHTEIATGKKWNDFDGNVAAAAITGKISFGDCPIMAINGFHCSNEAERKIDEESALTLAQNETLQKLLKEYDGGLFLTKGIEIDDYELFETALKAIPEDYDLQILRKDGTTVDARTLDAESFKASFTPIAPAAVYQRYEAVDFFTKINPLLALSFHPDQHLDPLDWLRLQFLPKMSLDTFKTLFENTDPKTWERTISQYIEKNLNSIDRSKFAEYLGTNEITVEAYRKVARNYYMIDGYKKPFIAMAALKKTGAAGNGNVRPGNEGLSGADAGSDQREEARNIQTLADPKASEADRSKAYDELQENSRWLKKYEDTPLAKVFFMEPKEAIDFLALTGDEIFKDLGPAEIDLLVKFAYSKLGNLRDDPSWQHYHQLYENIRISAQAHKSTNTRQGLGGLVGNIEGKASIGEIIDAGMLFVGLGVVLLSAIPAFNLLGVVLGFGTMLGGAVLLFKHRADEKAIKEHLKALEDQLIWTLTDVNYLYPDTDTDAVDPSRIKAYEELKSLFPDSWWHNKFGGLTSVAEMFLGGNDEAKISFLASLTKDPDIFDKFKPIPPIQLGAFALSRLMNFKNIEPDLWPRDQKLVESIFNSIAEYNRRERQAHKTTPEEELIWTLTDVNYLYPDTIDPSRTDALTKLNADFPDSRWIVRKYPDQYGVEHSIAEIFLMRSDETAIHTLASLTKDPNIFNEFKQIPPIQLGAVALSRLMSLKNQEPDLWPTYRELVKNILNSIAAFDRQEHPRNTGQNENAAPSDKDLAGTSGKINTQEENASNAPTEEDLIIKTLTDLNDMYGLARKRAYDKLVDLNKNRSPKSRWLTKYPDLSGKRYSLAEVYAEEDPLKTIDILESMIAQDSEIFAVLPASTDQIVKLAHKRYADAMIRPDKSNSLFTYDSKIGHIEKAVKNYERHRRYPTMSDDEVIKDLTNLEAYSYVRENAYEELAERFEGRFSECPWFTQYGPSGNQHSFAEVYAKMDLLKTIEFLDLLIKDRKDRNNIFAVLPASPDQIAALAGKRYAEALQKTDKPRSLITYKWKADGIKEAAEEYKKRTIARQGLVAKTVDTIEKPVSEFKATNTLQGFLAKIAEILKNILKNRKGMVRIGLAGATNTGTGASVQELLAIVTDLKAGKDEVNAAYNKLVARFDSSDSPWLSVHYELGGNGTKLAELFVMAPGQALWFLSALISQEGIEAIPMSTDQIMAFAKDRLKKSDVGWDRTETPFRDIRDAVKRYDLRQQYAQSKTSAQELIARMTNLKAREDKVNDAYNELVYRFDSSDSPWLSVHYELGGNGTKLAELFVMAPGQALDFLSALIAKEGIEAIPMSTDQIMAFANDRLKKSDVGWDRTLTPFRDIEDAVKRYDLRQQHAQSKTSEQDSVDEQTKLENAGQGSANKGAARAEVAVILGEIVVLGAIAAVLIPLVGAPLGILGPLTAGVIFLSLNRNVQQFFSRKDLGDATARKELVRYVLEWGQRQGRLEKQPGIFNRALGWSLARPELLYGKAAYDRAVEVVDAFMTGLQPAGHVSPSIAAGLWGAVYTRPYDLNELKARANATGLNMVVADGFTGTPRQGWKDLGSLSGSAANVRVYREKIATDKGSLTIYHLTAFTLENGMELLDEVAGNYAYRQGSYLNDENTQLLYSVIETDDPSASGDTLAGLAQRQRKQLPGVVIPEPAFVYKGEWDNTLLKDGFDAVMTGTGARELFDLLLALEDDFTVKNTGVMKPEPRKLRQVTTENLMLDGRLNRAFLSDRAKENIDTFSLELTDAELKALKQPGSDVYRKLQYLIRQLTSRHFRVMAQVKVESMDDTETAIDSARMLLSRDGLQATDVVLVLSHDYKDYGGFGFIESIADRLIKMADKTAPGAVVAIKHNDTMLNSQELEKSGRVRHYVERSIPRMLELKENCPSLQKGTLLVPTMKVGEEGNILENLSEDQKIEVKRLLETYLDDVGAIGSIEGEANNAVSQLLNDFENEVGKFVTKILFNEPKMQFSQGFAQGMRISLAGLYGLSRTSVIANIRAAEQQTNSKEIGRQKALLGQMIFFIEKAEAMKKMTKWDEMQKKYEALPLELKNTYILALADQELAKDAAQTGSLEADKTLTPLVEAAQQAISTKGGNITTVQIIGLINQLNAAIQQGNHDTAPLAIARENMIRLIEMLDERRHSTIIEELGTEAWPAATRSILAAA